MFQRPQRLQEDVETTGGQLVVKGRVSLQAGGCIGGDMRLYEKRSDDEMRRQVASGAYKMKEEVIREAEIQ